MSVVAAYIYADGRRVRDVDLADPRSQDMAKGEFAWIGMVEPSEEELRELKARFDLHPLAVEDALMAHRIPKVEVYGDQLFGVARTAHLEPGHAPGWNGGRAGLTFMT